jgi:YD repeat-containing protein
MRKALLLIALTFAGASAADGQSYLYHCNGSIYKGPVRSARVEHARFRKVGGEWVEGPRRLHSVTVFSNDRRTSEQTTYDPRGKATGILVRVCYEDGNTAEEALYDGERRPKWRKLYSRDGGEIRHLDADGRLQKREVVLRDEGGRRHVGRETYDADGVLVRRAVNTQEGGQSVWTTYDGEGRMLEKSVFSLNYGGPHHNEHFRYNPDGTVAGSRVSRSDARSQQLESEETGRGGAPARKLSERREYDSRRNLVKLTSYRHDPATGEMAPAAISYYEISYF